ncbi:hypothetical protein CPC08DRAFT_715578, partial [Agrocybe pediades]
MNKEKRKEDEDDENRGCCALVLIALPHSLLPSSSPCSHLRILLPPSFPRITVSSTPCPNPRLALFSVIAAALVAGSGNPSSSSCVVVGMVLLVAEDDGGGVRGCRPCRGRLTGALADAGGSGWRR